MSWAAKMEKLESWIKRCLILDEKNKILDVVKKRKMSCREIEQFKIGKSQIANVFKNDAHLRAEYEKFQRKGFNDLKERTIRNTKQWTKFCTIGLINAKLPESM